MWIRSLAILLAGLALNACASWHPPPPLDREDLRQRASHAVREEVEVRALVLSPQEGQRLLGVDIFEHDIEPVWIEVHNGTDQPLTLLQTGIDPDYYSPLEVSWLLHRRFQSGHNRAIDNHIRSVAFSRRPIEPGETRSGVIFTNPHIDTKLLNIDIFGRYRLIPFVMFLPVPDAAGNIRPAKTWPYSAQDGIDYQTEQELRLALQQFLCCRAGLQRDQLQQPLSLVWVGRPQDIGAALVRRGFRLAATEEDQRQTLAGRAPDYVVRSAAQGGTAGNWVRIWALPLTFQGRQVAVAQTGAPRGGRFATQLLAPSVDPALDHARDMLVQEMLYSGGLIKLAVMSPELAHAENSTGTDGRVAVLFIAARPVKLDQVRLSNWNEADWESEVAPYE